MSNDVIMAVLKSRGYAGHYNDALTAFFKDELGESGHINELSDKITKSKGFTSRKAILDRFEALFGDVNLITNGNFPDNVDGWNLPSKATLTWGNGVGIFDQTSGYGSAHQDIAVTPFEEYQFSVDIVDGTVSGRAFLSDRVGNTSSTITSSNSTTTFTPQNNSVRVYIGGLEGAGSCTFDNVKLVKVV